MMLPKRVSNLVGKSKPLTFNSAMLPDWSAFPRMKRLSFVTKGCAFITTIPPKLEGAGECLGKLFVVTTGLHTLQPGSIHNYGSHKRRRSTCSEENRFDITRKSLNVCYRRPSHAFLPMLKFLTVR